ncbi:MAG: chorismate-binding protein [Candidatus Caenarcaniphilales bacterium]|nr:chorismate-binding protein [Candidatus Caenarcaniphilales bacterium]
MQINPSIEQLQQYEKQDYNVIPLWTEILADLETPVSCFLKIKNHLKDSSPVFLLESVEGGEKLGRYSLIGLNPAALLTIKDNKSSIQSFWKETEYLQELKLNGNPFDDLQLLIDEFKSPANILPHSASGLVGALAYDSVRFIEPINNLKVESNYPEAVFVVLGDLIVFDNLSRTIRLITNVFCKNQQALDFPLTRGTEGVSLEKASERLENLKKIFLTSLKEKDSELISTNFLQNNENINDWESNTTKSKFIRVIEEAKERIRDGDIFQIVLSQQLKTKLKNNLNPFYIYRLLRSLNPSPYLFYFDFLDFQIIGSSPEVMVKSNAYEEKTPRTAILRPIAGTYRRGKSDKEDEELAQKLKQDPKELAEHLMLIDLARNDLGRVAVPGSVRLSELMIVEKYSHVLHLVSEVECKIEDGKSSIDLLKAVFPAGTLSGAPKVKAMQIIADLEPSARGFYGGCVGHIGFDGSVNTAMTIRTVLLKDKVVRLQAGAGIVYDSDPEKEYQETLNKGAALLKVIEQVERG